MPHPSTSSAYGIWTLNDVRQAVRGAYWPIVPIPLAVEDVFSTYLYTGNSSTQTITNGIDLENEGGLVWIKSRALNSASFTGHNHFQDTERGAGNTIRSDGTYAQTSEPTSVTSFNSNGFSLGSFTQVNANTADFASWTFRKAPKFFDVQTFTTTYNVDPNVISHNLGGELGCAIFKQLNSTGQGENWIVYHRSLGTTNYLRLNANSAQLSDSESFVSVDNNAGTISFGYPMSTVSDRLVSGGAETTNWVGYFFAHNDGDGEFGPTEDQDIIKCASYTGNGSTDGPEINLGFEPQWVLIKVSSVSQDWMLFDTMRGITTGGDDYFLEPNTSDQESYTEYLEVNATGFKLKTNNTRVNSASQNYIYIAIRRGPMKTPESGTEVFAMDQLGQTSPTPPGYNSPFPVDLGIQKGTVASSWSWTTRLLDGGFLKSDSTAAYATSSQWVTDFQNGFRDTTATSTDYYGYMFRRAPGFFDVVAYTGTGVARTVNHNLGVVPELIIVKKRNGVRGWRIYVSSLGNSSYLALDTDAGVALDAGGLLWNSTDPTSSVFTVSTSDSVNTSGDTYIAYLFATLPGVSKVGTYTGNGTSQTIDCGFTTGARFVLIKRTDSTGDWHIWDSERGIIAGNDPRLELNTTNAEDTGGDYIDPDSSGFAVTSNAEVNTNSAEYIFLAIS